MAVFFQRFKKVEIWSHIILYKSTVEQGMFFLSSHPITESENGREWNLNTFRFGGDCTPQSSSDKVIGSLGICILWQFFAGKFHVLGISSFPETHGNATES